MTWHLLHLARTIITTGKVPPGYRSIIWRRPPRVLWEVVEPRQRKVEESAFRVSYLMTPLHAGVLIPCLDFLVTRHFDLL